MRIIVPREKQRERKVHWYDFTFRVAKNYVPPYTLEFLRSLYYFAVDDVNTMCEHTTSIKINLSGMMVSPRKIYPKSPKMLFVFNF